MEQYIGLGVSLKETSICVVESAGTMLCEDAVLSEPVAIAGFVRSKAPGVLRIGLETGPITTWLWAELRALGLPVICIDARHAKAVLSMQINKSDRNTRPAGADYAGWLVQGGVGQEPGQAMSRAPSLGSSDIRE